MTTALSIGIPLAFLGLITASIWYVAFRLSVLFGTKRRWLLRVGVAVTVVCAMAAAFGAAGSASATVGAINVLGGYVLIFYFFLLLALLGLHAVQLKWKPPLTWSGVAALLLAFAVTGAGALWANFFTVKETEIRIPGLGRELVMMQISDVHLGHHRGQAYLARIVAETNRCGPDIVLITGDLIDSKAAFEPGVLAPLADLAAPAYFVGGNHEKYVAEGRAFDLIARHGVRVLRNEVVETHGIQLAGLDYMNADENAFDMHPSDDKRTIKSVLATLPMRRDLPTVLMHHSPVGVRYVEAKGVNLMLSGHTHAGQVFPFTLLTALMFPFNSGLWREGGASVFVSQGAGTFTTRVRLGTSNEINLLRLKPENS